MTIEEKVKGEMFEKIQTSKKAINEFIAVCNDKINPTIVEVKGLLTKEPFECATLDNASIIGNNKIVELVQLYNKKNMPLSGSCLRVACMNYYSEILNDIVQCTNRYYLLVQSMNGITTNINKVIPGIRRIALLMKKKILLELIKQVETVLAEYKYHTDQLFRFDLEKDANLLYECQLRLFGNDGEDRFIEKCNEELAALGISTRITKTKDEFITERRYEELKKILYNMALKVQDEYQQYPHVYLAYALHINDDIELLKLAYSKKDVEDFKKLEERIHSYNTEDLLKNVIRIIGEVGAYYGYGAKEFYQIVSELDALGLIDEAESIPTNIKNGTYSEYIILQAKLFEVPINEVPAQKRIGEMPN